MSLSTSFSSLRNESLACQLTSPDLVKRKQMVLDGLRRQIHESLETANGFVYKFNGGDGIIDQLAEFIKAERQCCPFFTFTLTIGKESEGVWLELAGPPGAKEFIKTELEF
jgi:hypothetical protein